MRNTCPVGQNINMADSPDKSNKREQRNSSSTISEKYGLRPRSVIRRLTLERPQRKASKTDPSKSSKSLKSRPPPLSKYRRKTANARERHRMKEINDAFESLRKILPDFCSRRAAATMTKITTLRLAVSYIRMLSHILEDDRPEETSFFDTLQMDISIGGAQISSMPAFQEVANIQRRPGMLQETMASSPDSGHTSTASSSSSSPARCSLSSSSDFGDLLSDGSSVFEDNLDAFDDIPALHEVDPFALLLATEGEVLLLEP